MYTIPESMKIVSKDAFFKLLYADPRDIMPNNQHPDYTSWETKQRTTWGISLPGWKHPTLPPVYAVMKEPAHA